MELWDIHVQELLERRAIERGDKEQGGGRQSIMKRKNPAMSKAVEKPVR